MKDCYYRKYEPVFGSWKIIEEIGAGTEGHLYRIMREDALGHVFYSALKAITIPASGEAELDSLIAGGMSHEEAEKYYDSILESTSHEFELLEKLKGNSNIVSYEDHEIYRRDQGFGWDVLIRLEELTPLVKHSIDHHMEEPEIIRLGKDICNALVLCRKYGIVHRDIKPENIFISPSGNYKLGDFGIARIIEKTDTVLSRKGTYVYMAPEVYWGKEYDYSVDVYSLGMVMYRYMNDGRMPLMPVYPEPVEYQDGERAFAGRVGGTAFPAPRNGSEGLKAIILKACAYDREERYSCAEEMLKDLEALSRNGVISAVKTSEKKEKASKRGRRILAAVIAVCLIGAGVIYALIPKEVESIDITGISDGNEVYIDEELSPEYTVQPEWFKDEPVTFKSSDEEVLAVDEEGKLCAGIPGEATLTVSAKEYSEDITIKVVPKVTAIEGVEKSIDMTTGSSLMLQTQLKPDQFADEPITYKSKNKDVATITEKGEITAVSTGTAEIKISAGGAAFTATVNVSDPVVVTYNSGSSGSSSKKSSSKKSSSSKKASKGYFDSSDDESF